MKTAGAVRTFGDMCCLLRVGGETGRERGEQLFLSLFRVGGAGRGKGKRDTWREGGRERRDCFAFVANIARGKRGSFFRSAFQRHGMITMMSVVQSFVRKIF